METKLRASGSAYTPSAAKLRIQCMPPRRRKVKLEVVGDDGQLRYPPKKSKEQQDDEDRRLAEYKRKKAEVNTCGTVLMVDLLSGEHWKRQKEAQRKMRKEKRQKMQELNKKKQAGALPHYCAFQKFEAPVPMEPDEQKRILIARAELELRKPVRPEDMARIVYYLTTGISDEIIQPYEKNYIKIAKQMMPIRYKSLRCYNSIMDSYPPEIMKAYNTAMRQHLLDYVLHDPYEWRRLRIQTYPSKYPLMIVKSPVPWHARLNISRQMIERHFFSGNPILLRMRKLWQTSYEHLLLLPVDRLDEDIEYPLDINEFSDKVVSLCAEMRAKIEVEWMRQCADMFLEMKDCWAMLIPHTHQESTMVVDALFRVINAFMSLMLRRTVVRSLEAFRRYMERFKEGNDFGEEYTDLAFINLPVVRVRVKPEVGTGNIKLVPSMAELGKAVQMCISRIMDSNEGINRLENIMFAEFQYNETFLHAVHEYEPPVVKVADQVQEYFTPNTIGPEKYLQVYDQYKYILNGEAEKNLMDFFNNDPLPYLKDFARRIDKYNTIKKEIVFLRRTIPLNFISLDCNEMNDTLFKIMDGFRLYIVNFFVQRNHHHNRQICDTFDEMSQKVSGTPETVQELVALYNYVIECRDVTMYNIKEKIRQTAENVGFLMSYAHLTTEDMILNVRVFVWPKDMENVIELALMRLNMKRDQAELVLKAKRSTFESKLKKHEKQVVAFKKKDPPMLTSEEIMDNTDQVEKLVQRLMEDKEEAEQINAEEQLLDYDPSLFANLYQMLASIDPYDRLWHTIMSFHQEYDVWYYGPFKNLDAEAINEEVEGMWRILYKLGKTLHDNPGARRLAEMVRAKVEKFRHVMPVLQTVCNKGLQPRHWTKIGDIMGVQLVITDASTLNDMIEAGMPRFISQLEEISGNATKEYALERNLKKMKDEWIDVVFDCVPYRDSGIHILAAVDDIQVLLDDHILKAQTMRGSPYVRAFEHEMQSWEEKLIMMQDILEQWLICQSTWMYLEPIFSSEDIMRQMPTEARNFKMVDRTWRAIQSNTIVDTHVLVATDFKNMLGLLRDANDLLDEIQKGLNNYLEKKRLFFPRFFFLSNDELLEILSETKDPQRVQPHLKKCFEGINTLKFVEDEIVGMISAEKEYVHFSGKIYPQEAKGMVEKWLVQVETLMIASLKDIMAESVTSYVNLERSDWILWWPGQIIQCVDCIIWTSDVQKAIHDKTLAKQVDICTQQIEQAVQMVQGRLDPGTTVTVEALIVIDVHGRDIVTELRNAKVDNTQDFLWISQLRYYWFSHAVNVAMITTDVAYGFEYLGNFGRLVATPLTDRCFRTLMGALKLNLGGAPEGPAGTGKTETCKDLAKAVAKKCVVFNCSDGLDYKALGKFFKGLAQAGSWACFDEFNRIDLEVLSVVAQQILCIQMAVASKLEKFIFEGTEISLDPTCTCFITMNPGYAGRQELPDNLKVLFRTVAMMVPDYAMIGEISLYSYGFINAASLAQKIVHTYKLCSEQLSSQNHYDYGMRAVKSVLLAAGALKRAYPQSIEAELVLRAIIDVNLPKFLAQDIALFNGIYSDLFPGIDVPVFDRTELINYLLKVLQQRNLQAIPFFVEKVMQIYEMILVRHGLMIVGDSMGGKTCAYQSLGEALGMLSQDKTAKLKENHVVYRIINPKAITMGQLYGQFDPASHEWSDGVLATTFREYANSQSTDRKWILFDGPVDAVWIENMNTVLDDNKKLCLMSGEIIQMSNSMNLIFEPADLEQASPATVSRCGMIYIEPHQLGWQPLLTSYVVHLNKILLAEQLELILEMIDWLVPPTFEEISRNCKVFTVTSDIHLFHSFTRLLTCVLKNETQVSTMWLQCVCLFCMVWGLGATLTADGRKVFDVFFRKILNGDNRANPKPKTFKLTKAQLFPDRANVFEWYFDKRNNGSWITWTETADKLQQIAPNANVAKLIIQTNESCCQQYFLKTCLNNNIPILFMGPTGTGKSAIVLDYLVSLPKERYLANVLNFSARTSSMMTQEVIMSKLDKRRRGVYGPAMGKKCVLFVDDLGMPQKEAWGAQPPVELLRQWIDHGHWFDKDTSMLQLIDILFVGGIGKPGGGANEITGRFLRHMLIMCMDSFEDNTLTKIFCTILEWHFGKGYPEPVSRLAKMVVAATMDVYKQAMLIFLPTPTKSHYTFSLRDFSRIIGGVVLIPPPQLQEPDKLIKLWIHETYRVFHDRLIDQDDRNLLFGLVKRATYEGLRQHIDKIVGYLAVDEDHPLTGEDLRGLFFGNYMNPDADTKIYDEVTDMEDLTDKMNYYLDDYNMMTRSPMNLVMFKFAIEHVSRVSRVLLQEAGNMMLVGIGGSGRHSAVKLATSMAEYGLYEIELSRTYGMVEWRDDLKNLLLRAGCEGKPLVFLFADTQIALESFTEDINMILNTGDVPNLYAPDEKAEILEKMQAASRDAGIKMDSTPLALYNFFIERVKLNLHIALCMSPIGDSFRVRCRMFPSLINCCTIDWFPKWPTDALERVANMFLSQTEITEELIEKCVLMCQKFHTTVETASDMFFKEQRRKTYVTPTSYLELIQTFKNFFYKQVEQITLQRDRYETGLEKLDFAASQVGVMQDELHALQPKLVIASGITEKLMIKIEQDTIIVEAKKEIVGADEALANEAAAAAQAIKDDCESDLAEAIPALNAALDALNTLKPADIVIVKSMKNPPSAIKLVLEAVCVMKQIKPERKPDPSSGKMVEDYWGPSVRLLADMKFLESLKTYDKDNIPAPVMKKIRDRYMPDREFDPAVVRTVSTACEGICKWVRAMEVYDRVVKIVAPKQARLDEAEAELGAQMATLNIKRAQLQEVTDKLQALNDEFAAETKKKKELEDDIEKCSQKLDRAEKLIGGLGGEKTRWCNIAIDLTALLGNVIGDVLLSSGVIAYLGAFTVDYRQNLMRKWNVFCMELGIPCSDPFSLVETMGEPIVIRAWNIFGLPVDTYSIENGIIATKARRWPLMIDPQGQANKWVKNMEKQNKLFVIKLTDSNYVRILENAIVSGLPVLLENIGQEIDAVLDPVLVKNVYKQQGVWYLKLGDNVLEFSWDFRFYITTRLRNPHYLPEVAVKVTLLNFMITLQGLQDQLLGIVVAKDRPELEEKKNDLIVQGATNKRLLKETEDKILQVLSSSEGNILEDETAIKILSSSKTISAEIQEKQKVAAVTELEIDSARNQYVPVSKHSSVLFFCISDLANIDPMYQYSLGWFINLYNQAILNSPKSDVLEERIETLNDYFTNSIYRNVCRSLFEKDKLIFSFVLSVGILRSHGKIDEEIWNFLLTGGVALQNPHPNPAPKWLSDKSWSEFVRASNLPGLKDLYKSVESEIDDWKTYYDTSNPHELPFPAPFDKVNKLGRLVVLRCIRPDKVVPAVQMYIVEEMGQAFLEPPQFNLEESYNDSNPCSPLVFILSAGSDPMAGLIRFAADKGIEKTSLFTISLGQGQGPIASNMIDTALDTGQWVVLQNCHLAESWMRELDRICDEVVVPENTHKNFRLWLTSYPSRAFPVSILQNGVKMTNEAPKGLRQNLLRSYLSDPISNKEFFNKVDNWHAWQTMLFALCFFHGIVQERKKFGPLGWNIPYEFNESDLRISVIQLQMFLGDYEEVPYEALVYLTGECNYGGRVTDDKDRRLLNSLLSIFYCQDTVNSAFHPFSSSGIYFVPQDTSYNGILNYVRGLPLIPRPEVFGLHENADITKDNQETQILLNGVLLTQTQISGGGGGDDSAQLVVINLANSILAQVPNPFDILAVSKQYPVMYMNSMNTVLKQELIRFNKLIRVVQVSLANVIKGIKGEVVMSSELEDLYYSLVVGKIPEAWAGKSYPSLKPLGSYVLDLITRLEFLQKWIEEGPPPVFWLSGFYFTQSFLTGVLQNYSRKMQYPIDHITFDFFVTEYETEVPELPDIGIYFKGLFLEGARWDREEQELSESFPKILFDVVPIMWLKPNLIKAIKQRKCYNCPIYKTSARRGTLSTTGHSTNFVMYTIFDTSVKETHWINRGVAGLCQLDD